MTMFKKIGLMAAVLIATLGLTATANAQIFVVDNERVEREAAAYKDFNLQTDEMRQQIVQLRQYVSRGGAAEQQLGELEQKKSIIGNDKYEKEKKKLQDTYGLYQQNLQILEYRFDQVRQEAMVQVERARQPVIRALLKSRKAQIILPKRLVFGSAAGLDITTEFIELLDAELPSVTLTKLPQAQPAAAAAPAPKK
jgi:Skp family chaperone for outer membrane proteins